MTSAFGAPFHNSLSVRHSFYSIMKLIIIELLVLKIIAIKLFMQFDFLSVFVEVFVCLFCWISYYNSIITTNWLLHNYRKSYSYCTSTMQSFKSYLR